jgi:hypothetical protein
MGEASATAQCKARIDIDRGTNVYSHLTRVKGSLLTNARPRWSSSCHATKATPNCPVHTELGRRRVQAVLILSSDPLAAALLGAAVELAGHIPHFKRNDESSRAVLLRVRPRLALIDCDHEESCSDEFVGPAIMTGARILLFRSARTTRDMHEFADRLSLRIVDMPAEHLQLTSILEEMLAD